MGRWMSPDWAAKPEAVPYSSLDNPQSLNLYGYVLNNPLSHADADGHCCQAISDFLSGAGGAVGSDMTAGVKPKDTPDSTAGRAGASFGDALSAVQGGLETVVGAAGEVGGTLADASGAGAAVGIPINVGAAAVATLGVATATTAVTALMKSGSNNQGAGTQGGKKYRTAAENRNSVKESVRRKRRQTSLPRASMI